MNIFIKTSFFFILSLGAFRLQAQELKTEVFSYLNLDYPGLEKVKAFHQKGDDLSAAKALLAYYRQRTQVHNPDIDLNHITITKEEKKWADDALNHTFFAHKGYQPSFNYGKDINWQYWPVKDNELRWQLHRHKWFTPMGKAYRITGDEKYAKEWTFEYIDWIKKNPLVKVNKDDYEMKDNKEIKSDVENARFAWRPLEVSNRLADQTVQFLLFLPSPSFTPEFLTEFLVNYRKHALHIMSNYSERGNHLLFEAQRMIYAGTFFPEFKEAPTWRKSGIDILNKQINVQVYKDGGQFELDPGYHLACIDIFYKALAMADMNGFRNEFPQSYLDTIEKMIVFYMNLCFPDHTAPCFSDAKLNGKSEMMKNYRKWGELFKKNQFIRYMRNEGKKGELPEYLSKGFLDSGFFVFRNSWADDATMMVVKAGPKGEWHCQPDNGTFELWFNGKNLFPDSGSYVYAGDEEVMKQRNWFRQTCVHNTLTLDNKNLETTQSLTKLWKPEGNVQVLVTENNSYKDLKHRRSVFFVDQTYFVIVDEAVGAATGKIGVHYEACEGAVDIDKANHTLTSDYEGDSNFKLQCFSPKPITLTEEEGWRSTEYKKKTKRTAVSFETNKNDNQAVRYITVIYPTSNIEKAPAIEAQFKSRDFNEKSLDIEVKINGKKKSLNYKL
jgi:heparan-sulfate lyase